MSIKKHTLTIFLVGFAALLFAQTVQVSPELLVEGRDDYRLVGRVHDTAVVLLYDADSFVPCLYDKTLTTLQRAARIRPEAHNIEILQTATDRDFFTVLYRSSGNQRSVTKALRLNAQGKLLDSATVQMTNQWGLSYDPTVVLSEDRSKVLVYDLLDNNTIFNAVVFDLRTMQVLWSRAFRPTGLDYHNSLRQAVVDNNGGAYWAIERDNRKAKIANNRFDILYYTADLSQEWTITVPMTGRLWQDVLFTVDNKNKKLLCGGFFSNKKSQSEGIFYFQLAPLQANATPTVYFSVFDATFMQQILGKAVKGNEGFENFTVQQIVARGDAGVLVAAEFTQKIERSAMQPAPNYGTIGSLRPTIDYDYNDIMLVSVYPTGGLQWYELLPKRQSSQDDEAMYSSFFVVKNKSGLRFLYNDDIKNGGNLNEYAVLPDGTAARRNLYNSQRDKLELLVKEAKQVSATEVLVPSLVRNRMNLALLRY